MEWFFNIKLVCLIVFSSFLGSHAQKNNKTQFKDSLYWVDVRALKLPFDSVPRYLPEQLCYRDSSKKPYWGGMFNAVLAVLEEPVLYSDTADKEVYRFTWRRYKEDPFSFRIERNKGALKLYVKQSDGAGCCFPGNKVRDTVVDLTLKQWNHFIQRIGNIDFWNMPTFIDDAALHPTIWVLEGSTKNSYYFVRRAFPRKSKFGRCCKYLIKLSGLKIPRGMIY